MRIFLDVEGFAARFCRCVAEIDYSSKLLYSALIDGAIKLETEFFT